MSDYYSDREFGSRPRMEEVLGPISWAGIVGLAEALARSGAFGLASLTPVPTAKAFSEQICTA